MSYLFKIFISTALIVAISEVSKRSPVLGGLLASLPVVSYLGIIFLYADTKDISKVSELSISIFWLVLPTLIFFIALPYLLKRFSFLASISSATILMICLYTIMVSLLKKFGFTI